MKKIIDFFVSFWNKLEKEEELNEEQRHAFEIFKTCVSDENNLLQNGEDSEKRKFILAKSYWTSHDTNTFIVLQSDINMNVITIANHEYKYHVSMPPRTAAMMKGMFNKRLKEDVLKMENEILSNVVNSLSLVRSQLDKNFEQTKEEPAPKTIPRVKFAF